MQVLRLLRRALAATAIASFAVSIPAQTLQPRITVGSSPVAVAVNPITGKVYVANSGSNTVTIIDGASSSTITTLPVGAYPAWVAADAENNRIYVSSFTGANTTLVDGAANTVIKTLATGGAGWTAIDPTNGAIYTMRYGGGDEVNMIQNELYQGTASTRSYQPVSVAVNPINNWLYVADAGTGDIASLDMTTYNAYPPLKCPDGSGGFKPQPPVPPPGGPDPWPGCIDIPGTPAAVAINPLTNRIYAISSGGSQQIAVIDGSNNSFVTLSPTGGVSGARTIAANPVTNNVYAVFANAVVVVNGADNTMTTIPIASGNAVAIGINVLTNKIYVPKDNGTLLMIDGGTLNTTTVTGLTTGSNAIAVDPLANTLYVTDSAGGVTPISGATSATPTAVGITTSITPFPGNTAGTSGSLTLNATSSMSPAPLGTVRKVYYRIDLGPWTQATGSGPYTAAYTGVTTGSHTIQAFATNGLEESSINTDLAHVPILGNLASYTFTAAAASAPAIGLAPTSLDFGGQSMATTSPAQSVTVTNTGTGSLDISGITVSSQFGQTNDCTSLAAGASCTIQVTFSPAVAAGALNSTAGVTGQLTITSNASGSPHQVGLAGVAEKSLVTHYYRSILRRAPDSGGKVYWTGEAQRMSDQGANVNEAWYAMAAFFYNSAEYGSFNRDDSAFVTDLYNTFFNRAPDSGGLAFWVGQIQQGLPREVVLAGFMFSPEFQSFAQSIFGNTSVRPEIDAVTDFYRGILARLADNGGLANWVQQFRSAQCQGGSAVYAQVESISSAFTTSAEYASRNRTNAQFVGDLYNAFLRRGGDLQGVQYWINQLDSHAQTREQVRRAFISTPEYNNRVNAIVNAGCTS